jgi:hypothetical protein
MIECRKHTKRATTAYRMTLKKVEARINLAEACINQVEAHLNQVKTLKSSGVEARLNHLEAHLKSSGSTLKPK